LQILAGREAAAGAGEDDGTNLRIARLLQRLAQPGVQGAVERVQHLGPVQRDRLDAALAGDLDLGHARTLPRHLPLKSGGRFSTNAFSPSPASSDARAR